MNAHLARLFGLATALVVACSLASCGGSSKASPPTTTTTIAPSATAAGKPWVDALVASATNSPDKPPGVTDTQIHCLATSIVDTYGAAAFPAAGYTIAKVENPDSKLDKLSATPAQLTTLGRHVQQCRLGALLAPSLSQEFGTAARADTNSCLAAHLDADPPAGRFLALAFLSRDPDRPAARALVDLMARCSNLAVLATKDIPGLTPTERACVGPKLAASSTFRDLVAEQIVGAKPTTAELLRVALDAMVGCVTPQRLAQLGRTP